MPQHHNEVGVSSPGYQMMQNQEYEGEPPLGVGSTLQTSHGMGGEQEKTIEISVGPQNDKQGTNTDSVN